MPLVTEKMIRWVAPKAKYINDLVKYLNLYFEKYKINTPLRINHFLAQAAHETMGFTVFSEAGWIKDQEIVKKYCN